MGRRRWLIGAVVLLAVSSSCAAQPESVPAPEAAWRPAPSRADGAPTALLEGGLVEDSGCLYVDAGDRRYVPVFDGEPRWASAGALRVGGTTYRVGDEVQLGGSELGSDPGELEIHIPDACDSGAPRWLVFGS